MSRPASSSNSPDRSPRDAAARVARELKNAGFIAYFAGGCVRDRLLGLDPNDYDVATDATPDQIAKIFRRTRGVGVSFGVVLVNLMGHSIEVTTFRADGEYSDSRRPDSITFATPERDAARRDFTMNGMFEEPESGAIIDYVGGKADLDAGIVRAIGDPEARLREDRLRMVRGVRFAARFGFELDPATRAAIVAGAERLDGISRERIGQEVELMIGSPTRGEAARLLQDLGLDGAILQEPATTAELPRLSGLPPGVDSATALAGWWLDRAESRGLSLGTRPEGWRKALVLSNQQWSDLERTLITVELLAGQWSGLGVASRKRLVGGGSFAGAIELLGAVDSEIALEIREDVVELGISGGLPVALVDGSDLIRLGLPPGPDFKGILERVYDAQLEGRVLDRVGAVALAENLARSRESPE